MSNLQTLRMCFLGKRIESVELILSCLKVGKFPRAKNTFRSNQIGYVRFHKKFGEYVISPLYKMVDTIFSNDYCRWIANSEFYNYNNNSRGNNFRKRDYRSWRFVLGSAGLTVALCEGPNFNKGEII